MKCAQKVPYHSMAQAEEGRRALIKQHPKDPRNARLVCYPCRDCRLYHVGHLRAEAKPKLVKAAPALKPPTPGQRRRKARREAEAFIKRDQYETLTCIKRLVDAEIARMEALGVPKRIAEQPYCQAEGYD